MGSIRVVLPLVAFTAMHAAGQEPVGVQARNHINHVVIIVQENRTFDNIFGGFAGGPKPFHGADSTVPPDVAKLMQPGHFGDPGSITASHNAWQCLKSGCATGIAGACFGASAWKSLETNTDCFGTYSGGPFNSHPFYYLIPDLRKTYWDIAEKYAVGDRFFAVTSTASFPGHQYIVADQSTDPEGDTVADQPGIGSGCFAGVNAPTAVPVLGSNGYFTSKPNVPGGACYNNPTLADLMDKKGVTWSHYVTVQWNGSAFQTSYMFDGFINNQARYLDTNKWPTSRSDLQADINSHKLGKVTWVKPPCKQLSDHPAGASNDDSANWVGSVVNWIGSSKYWDDTVIFVVWDDWGGFYDHVVPPETRTSDKLGPGVRTPFLVVSPFVPKGTVLHTQADYGSVLKFVEDLFDLGHLTSVDQNATDLTGLFDFQKHRVFEAVKVKKSFYPGMCPSASGVDDSLIDR